MTLSAGTKRTLLWGAVVILALAGIGWAVETAFKTKYKNEYRRLVADYDQQISVDGPEETARTLDGLQRVIGMAAGRVTGKSWSAKDIDFFMKPAIDRAAYLLELMCARSENGVDLHGYRMADVRDVLRGGLIAVAQQMGSQKGRALSGLGYMMGLSSPTGGLPTCEPRPGVAASPGPFLDPRKPYQPGQASAQMAVRRPAPAPAPAPIVTPGPAPAASPTPAAPLAQPSPEMEQQRLSAELRNTLGLIVRLQNRYFVERKRYADDLRGLIAGADTSPDRIQRALALLDTGKIRMRLMEGGYEVGAEAAPGQWEVVSNKGAQGTRSSF